MAAGAAARLSSAASGPVSFRTPTRCQQPVGAAHADLDPSERAPDRPGARRRARARDADPAERPSHARGLVEEIGGHQVVARADHEPAAPLQGGTRASRSRVPRGRSVGEARALDSIECRERGTHLALRVRSRAAGSWIRRTRQNRRSVGRERAHPALAARRQMDEATTWVSSASFFISIASVRERGSGYDRGRRRRWPRGREQCWPRSPRPGATGAPSTAA